MKRLSLISGILLILAAAVSPLGGQTSFSLSPVQLNLKISAGGSAGEELVVGNDSFNDVRIRADVEDWTIGDAGSDVFPGEDGANFSCRDWIKVEEPEFLLKPGQRRKIPLQFLVPSSAAPGQYLAAVALNAAPGDASRNFSSVMIQGRLVGVVFITVGDPKAEGSVVDMAFEKKDGRNVIVVRAKNSGRTFLEASGKIEIRNVKGKKILTADIPEDLVPPLAERLLPVVLEKDVPPGTYQVRCLLRLPSRKNLEMKKNLDIR